MQISSLSYDSIEYPDRLRHIGSPPKELFILGELPKSPCVAIVGSRKPTEYGIQMAYEFSKELASAGITIVSGLAIGVDGIAHQAALDAGGTTIAVLGAPLNKIYPYVNRSIAIDILKTRSGALVSEYPVGAPVFPSNFAVRNRIITGLSLGVIIIEATAKSGTDNAVKFALAQNREVMAVPGNITNTNSAGPHKHIREGATLVTGSADVMSILNLEEIAQQPVKASGPEEQAIINLITKGTTHTQELIEQSHLSAAQFANIISLMEISGKVRNLGAGKWVTR